MEITLHNVTKITQDLIVRSEISGKCYRTIYIYDEEHGKIEISIFGKKSDNLIIKDEE